MKIGDKFTHYGSTLQIVSFGSFSHNLTLISEATHSVLKTFQITVKDKDNITREEFKELMRANDIELNDYKDSNGNPLFPDPLYSYGDDFVIINSKLQNMLGKKYKLCQVDYSKMSLISFENGNRFGDSIVVDNPTEVTESEFKLLLGKNCSESVFKKV